MMIKKYQEIYVLV